jgi:SAM-dependent methyltransferase
MTDWDEFWREKFTPWDLGGISPPLKQLIDEQKGLFEKRGTILVPGCGRGYDLELLSKQYDKVIGLEISSLAVQAARAQCSDNRKISIEQGDFFNVEKEFDAVFDYTFFCAIEPSMRDKWAEKITNLLGPKGLLIAIIFPNIDKAPRDHPPYPVSLPDYTTRLPKFELVHLNKNPLSHPSRLGKEMMAVFRKIL